MPHKPEPDASRPNSSLEWFIYMIRCNNGHLYTGISTDVARRFTEHQSGKGAKYLRGKGPLQLVYQKKAGTRSEALKAEIKVKKMSRQAKEQLIARIGITGTK